ncbi:MAG TPA: L-threonylcarbamoyladenylate synthase [Candidatus Megaira endosymbiont of Hartmannula sinica]|nr:L-threonylcarbamoyladenylate synthase [Candidatus Megaera endosymbiont of Hartmannula sinica]
MNARNIIIEKAAKLLLEEKLVAFPTETVFGLGGDATSDIACNKIYSLKNRPSYNPLIIHVSSIEEAEKIAILNKQALLIADHFWPGPITMILPLRKGHNICKVARGGNDKTIAIRISCNSLALEIIKRAGKPLAAPSANKSGKLSSTKYIHVYEQFKKSSEILNINSKDNNKRKELFVINDKEINQLVEKSELENNKEKYIPGYYGLESTIIDLSNFYNDNIKILRPGIISARKIENKTGLNITYIDSLKNNQHKPKILPKAEAIFPGMLKKHYSPNAKLRLNVTSLKKNEIGLGFGKINLINKLYPDFNYNLSVRENYEECARNIYNFLYIADKFIENIDTIDTIAVSPIGSTDIGVAINNRLIRAASED